MEELFGYLEEKVREFNPDQDPRKWEFDVQGPIWVAKASHGALSPYLGREDSLVLIADDDRDIVRFIEINLRLEGLDVITADDGKEALAKALDLQPNLILLDVMMPGMDGFEVLTKLRADGRSTHIPVIMLTAKSLSADKVLGLTAGADDYIIKPFEPMELVARVKTTLQRMRVYEAHAARQADANRSGWPFS